MEDILQQVQVNLIIQGVASGILIAIGKSLVVDRRHRSRTLRTDSLQRTVPEISRALDTPEAVVDGTAMALLIPDLVNSASLLGRKERRLATKIASLERQRWALVGFGPGTGKKAIPEYHLKNEMRAALEDLSRLLKIKLSPIRGRLKKA